MFKGTVATIQRLYSIHRYLQRLLWEFLLYRYRYMPYKGHLRAHSPVLGKIHSYGISVYILIASVHTVFHGKMIVLYKHTTREPLSTTCSTYEWTYRSPQYSQWYKCSYFYDTVYCTCRLHTHDECLFQASNSTNSPKLTKFYGLTKSHRAPGLLYAE